MSKLQYIFLIEDWKFVDKGLGTCLSNVGILEEFE
jgi:hypothetical protein